MTTLEDILNGIFPKVEVPFFFKRKIRLARGEAEYVSKCIADTRKALVKAQRDFDDSLPYCHWDLRNGLTLYLVVLGEIAKGRTIRYSEPLKPSACMAAYLGHDRMLKIMARNGVPMGFLQWDSLNILFAAILGRHLRLVKQVLADYPHLRTAKNYWFGNAGSFCAGFGNVRILRFLRNAGFDLAEPQRLPWQRADDSRHFGSALLFAMRQGRGAIADDLLAHGEYCPWENLGGEYIDCKDSVFVVAVKHHFFNVAKTYLENGWYEPPLGEDDFWTMIRRSNAYDDFAAFRFLEEAFPQFDAKHAVCKHIEEVFDSRIRRYCGAEEEKPAWQDWQKAETIHGICEDIRHWIRMKDPDMVRFTLNEVPEILPLVWSKLGEQIRAAFSDAPGNASPCRRYLFRLAQTHGMSLCSNEIARRFWEKESKEHDLDVFLARLTKYMHQEEEMAKFKMPEGELTKYVRAVGSCGKEARRMMDDPEIDPNHHLYWNAPFSVLLGDIADWATFKGWLLRGMKVYWDNQDDPGCFEIASSPSIVRHLLPDLEHRPWESRSFSGNTLRCAAEAGDIAAAKALLDAGCPVNFCRWVPGEKLSPLRMALLNGHDAMAKFLYACGGLNIRNGIVFPVPRWIEKPRLWNKDSICLSLGIDKGSVTWIDLLTPLPQKLDGLRKRWLWDAKELNGHCLCLIPSAPDTLVFRFDSRLYALRRESVAMDNDAFEQSFDYILRGLESIGCPSWQSRGNLSSQKRTGANTQS